MIRVFCDSCGDEIQDKNSLRNTNTRNRLVANLKTKNGKNKMSVEIIIDSNNVSNLDFCKYCVFDAISTLDDRGN